MLRFAPAGLASALLAVLASCGESADTGDARACRGDFTPIVAVQGSGYVSPIEGQTVSVSGIVTRLEPGHGFYLEDPAQRLDEAASRALFVTQANPGPVQVGQALAVSGRVEEYGDGPDTLTALAGAQIGAPCAEGVELPLTPASLPLDPAGREALEGMRLDFEPVVVLTDGYGLSRGRATLSASAPLRAPTEDFAPGAEAVAAERGEADRRIDIELPPDMVRAMPVGSMVGVLVGVLSGDGERQRLQLDHDPQFTLPDSVPLEPHAPGTLRIVGLNLLNFFNGDGKGGGFPTERGAKTPEAFAAQKQRTGSALARIQPDLLAVSELENDGFGPESAARSMLDILNQTGHDDWQVVDPGFGPIGGDAITVGLFYRAGVLEPVGGPHLLDGPAFNRLSRQPLAHRFRDRISGATLLVAANHLKSKGRCPGDSQNADQRDGQGCWNRARVEAVEALAPWLQSLASELGTENVLILGDMNAWRREDPIQAYRDAGFIELVEQLSGLPQYSYVYYGQRGTLDYAFASPGLARFARRAMIWHVNADWPPGLTPPEPWLRMSDHDPAIVDLDFSQSATSD